MAEEAAQPSLTINTQYVKDHSFENPNAPAIYGTLRTEKPDLNVSVEVRSEEHTSELQSLLRISYAVFCLKKITNTTNNIYILLLRPTSTIRYALVQIPSTSYA